jgi:hypothetical protein
MNMILAKEHILSLMSMQGGIIDACNLYLHSEKHSYSFKLNSKKKFMFLP